MLSVRHDAFCMPCCSQSWALQAGLEVASMELPFASQPYWQSPIIMSHEDSLCMAQ